MNESELPASAALSERAARSIAPFGAMDLALIGLVTIWGVNFVVIKAAVAEILPLGFTALRFTFASAMLVAAAALAGLSLRVSRADLGRLALLGLVGNVLYQPMFVIGLAHTTAGNSSIILASAPVIVAVESHFLKEERLSARAWAGVLLSFVGLGLVIVGGPKALSLAPETLLGDVLTLGAAICWGTYTVMARPVVARLDPLVVTAYAVLVGAGALLLIAAPSFAAQNWGAVTLGGWAGLLYSGLLAIGLGYAIWVKGVQRLGGSRTAVYSNLTPLIAALTGVIFLGERITLLQIVGAACVLGGIVLTRVKG
jgi:drug/metabolite transporter (DMT)-like permease